VTTRLYYTDSRLDRFTARVVERADEGRRVYLDRTAFYPTSGGQPHDVGTLGGVAVIDVVDEGERVAHLLDAPLGDTGEVEGVVDWARRLDHMQQHTGQHVLSAVLLDVCEAPTVSVHFGDELATVDVAVPALSREQVLAAERRANEIVCDDRPVHVDFEDAATVQGLRRPPKRAGTIRVVTIDGVDRSACGGTHVARTGEIGPVLLRRVEKVKQGTRVEFVCGLRAVRRARADYDALATIAASMSASVDDVPRLVSLQRETMAVVESERRAFRAEVLGARARALHAAATPDARGRRVIAVHDARDPEELRTLAQAMLALPACILVGALRPATGPATLLVAASEDSGADAGALLRPALAAVGGRGGGSPRLAQGSVPDAARVEEAIGLVERGE
jgi:alanyl-tRNA synthetase